MKASARLGAGLAVVIVLAAGAGFVARGFTSPDQLAARAAPPPPALLTAPVESRDLDSQVIFRASATELNPVTAAAPSSIGTDRAVLTSKDVSAGQQISNGEVLASVAGRPIIVLQGQLTAYRTMTLQDSGPDVRQLQNALTRLGYGLGSDVKGVYGKGTARAVERFYRARKFTTIDVAAPEGTSGGVADGLNGTARGDGQTDSLAESTKYATLPLGEVVFVPRLPTTVVSSPGSLGGLLGTGAPVAILGSGRVLVSGLVDERQRAMLRPRQTATITSDVDSRDFTAQIASVATDAQAGPAGPTYQVVLSSSVDLSSIVGQDVGVRVRTTTSAGRGLVVPAAAVTTAADGRTSVTVLRKGGRQDLVTVSAGASANGAVSIKPSDPAALSAGDQVVLGIAGSGP